MTFFSYSQTGPSGVGGTKVVGLIKMTYGTDTHTWDRHTPMGQTHTYGTDTHTWDRHTHIGQFENQFMLKVFLSNNHFQTIFDNSAMTREVCRSA